MASSQRILVRSPNWIGDQILAYPFFHYLRKAFPGSYIAVVCSPWVESVQFRNLVDEVHSLGPPKDRSFLSKLEALENAAQNLIKAGPWDLGICLPNSFSSAWLLYRAKVKKIRGYSLDGRRLLLHEPVKWSRKVVLHRAEAYVRLLPDGGGPIPPVTEFWGVEPTDRLDSRISGVLEVFDAERAWPLRSSDVLIEPPREKYWVLAPGTTAESRRWPQVRFSALARMIADQTGWTGVIVGGKAESQIAQSLIRDPSLKLLDWTARGNVHTYWPLFRQAQFTVCNDSGLAHVASICGSPVHVVWGAGNPKRTEPLGPGKVRITLNPVDCWPCESNICSQPRERAVECLSGIQAETIWKEIKAGVGNWS